MVSNGVYYFQTYTEMIANPIGPDTSSPPSQPPGQAAHE